MGENADKKDARTGEDIDLREFTTFLGGEPTQFQPKYLYKVMKVEYFLKALRFGDIAFMSGKYSKTGSNVNVDVGEAESKAKKEEAKFVETKGTKEVAFTRFMYCFTTQIDLYVSHYTLKSDEIVLRFRFEDVIDFFNSIDIYQYFHGRVCYNGKLNHISHVYVQERQPQDIHISETGETVEYTNYKIEGLELESIENQFKKSRDFIMEQEYRFVCIPHYTYDVRYISVDNGVLYEWGTAERFNFDKSKGMLVKFVPQSNNRFKPLSFKVMELFCKAELVDGSLHSKDAYGKKDTK